MGDIITLGILYTTGEGANYMLGKLCLLSISDEGVDDILDLLSTNNKTGDDMPGMLFTADKEADDIQELLMMRVRMSC